MYLSARLSRFCMSAWIQLTRTTSRDLPTDKTPTYQCNCDQGNGNNDHVIGPTENNL